MHKFKQNHLKGSVLPLAMLFLCGLWVGSALVGVAASHADLVVYPAKGQSQEQQAKDMAECAQWATQQTGFDPSRPPNFGGQSAQPQQGAAVRGAARGAALGAIGGAIAGDAGKGAAIGAAVGGTGGALKRRRARRAQEEAQEQANQAYQQSLQKFNAAKATCLKGRGYTVSGE